MSISRLKVFRGDGFGSENVDLFCIYTTWPKLTNRRRLSRLPDQWNCCHFPCSFPSLKVLSEKPIFHVIVSFFVWQGSQSHAFSMTSGGLAPNAVDLTECCSNLFTLVSRCFISNVGSECVVLDSRKVRFSHVTYYYDQRKSQPWRW